MGAQTNLPPPPNPPTHRAWDGRGGDAVGVAQLSTIQDGDMRASRLGPTVAAPLAAPAPSAGGCAGGPLSTCCAVACAPVHLLCHRRCARSLCCARWLCRLDAAHVCRLDGGLPPTCCAAVSSGAAVLVQAQVCHSRPLNCRLVVHSHWLCSNYNQSQS